MPSRDERRQRVVVYPQAVFSQAEGLEGEATETHYYYPATIAADTTPATMVTSVHAADSLLTQPTPAGR